MSAEPSNAGKAPESFDEVTVLSLASATVPVSCPAGIEVKPTPEPLKDVAVTTPVRVTLPVPVISLLLTSKLPPRCGVVASTTFLRNVLDNLPSVIEPAN